MPGHTTISKKLFDYPLVAKIQGLELNGVAKKTHQKITRENFVSITMGFFIFYFEVVHAEENDMAYNAPIDTNCIGDE